MQAQSLASFFVLLAEYCFISMTYTGFNRQGTSFRMIETSVARPLHQGGQEEVT